MAPRRIDTDVVFVGGGSAGLCGAVRARELGMDALIMEKLGSCGGDGMISAGFWIAAESSFQKKQGIEDSKEALYRYFMDYSAYKCKPDLIRVLVNRAADNLEWLQEQGLSFTGEVQAHGPTTVPRVHQNEGMGAQYMKTMKDRADAVGVEILFQTGARKLLVEKGRVVGVSGQTEEGDTVDVYAKGVVLTTGGFGKQKDMVQKYVPFQRHAMVCAGWARGDGVRLAEEAGARIGDLIPLGYKAEMPETAGLSMRSFFLILLANYAVVNKLGRRFMDESIWNPYFSHALQNQPECTGYVIIDEAIRTGNPFTDLAKETESGRIKKGDTFAALAEQAGLPVDPFVSTMEQYNSYARTGIDLEFGKASSFLAPLENAPFYAIEVVPLVLNTVGGAVIDANARVLDSSGSPIPGLYAAGNNTSGFYESYPSTGSGLQISSIFGQVAAEHIKAAQ